jgi:hypothetical protein
MDKKMSIEEETQLIYLLKSINNGSKEVRDQLEHAERRLRHLERNIQRRREQKSFIRRIEQEVGQEKLSMFLLQHGVSHLASLFKHMTLHDFQRSDPVDWPPMSETDLRQLLFLR